MTWSQLIEGLVLSGRTVLGLIVIGYFVWGFYGVVRRGVEAVIVRRRERGSW